MEGKNEKYKDSKIEIKENIDENIIHIQFLMKVIN